MIELIIVTVVLLTIKNHALGYHNLDIFHGLVNISFARSIGALLIGYFYALLHLH
jgi:hypothetical protein